MESLSASAGKALETRPVDVNSKTEALPLRNPWTFWVGEAGPNSTPEAYGKCLIRIGTMKSPMEFWNSYEFMTPPSAMPKFSSCHMMKGVFLKPMREEWLNGGQYRFTVQKTSTDQTWHSLLLMAIGENYKGVLNDGDNICGVSVTICHTQDEVKIWNVETGVGDADKFRKLLKIILPDVNIELVRYLRNRLPSYLAGSSQK